MGEDSILIEPGTEESIGGLFSRLVEDTERFARAEVRLYRAHVFGRLAIAKSAVAMAIGGVLIAQATIGALLVGLVLTLQPVIGPGWATLVVVLGALAIAGVLLWLAIRGFGKVFGAGSPGE